MDESNVAWCFKTPRERAVISVIEATPLICNANLKIRLMWWESWSIDDPGEQSEKAVVNDAFLLLWLASAGEETNE